MVSGGLHLLINKGCVNCLHNSKIQQRVLFPFSWHILTAQEVEATFIQLSLIHVVLLTSKIMNTICFKIPFTGRTSFLLLESLSHMITPHLAYYTEIRLACSRP